MHEPLQESTQSKARELARQVTVANDLDPEIQEELYGHIEDKLVAYMNGDESVSEEDAFILVREHFGNTDTLRNLLQDVHLEAVQVGIGRKVLALIIAGGCIGAAARATQSAFNLAVFVTGVPHNFATYKLIEISFVAVMLAALLSVLSRWKNAVTTGSKPWYVQWPLSRLSARAALVCLVTLAIPSVHAQYGGGPRPLFGALMFAVLLALLVAFCAVWLWWVDTPPRRARNIFNAGAMWLGFLMLASLLPTISVYMGSGGPVAYSVTTLSQGHFGDTAVTGYLTWGGPWRSFFDVGLVAGFYGFVTIVGCLTYLGWQASRRRPKARIHAAGLSS